MVCMGRLTTKSTQLFHAKNRNWRALITFVIIHLICIHAAYVFARDVVRGTLMRMLIRKAAFTIDVKAAISIPSCESPYHSIGDDLL